MLHIHQTGELLDIIFHPGAEFTSTGAVNMLEANILWLKSYFNEIILLADDGFYEKAVVHFCERDDLKIKFIITSEINNPIRQQLSAPERTWTQPEQPTDETDSEVKHRDSHTFNYRH